MTGTSHGGWTSISNTNLHSSVTISTVKSCTHLKNWRTLPLMFLYVF